ncbi:hypothetical protein SH139x_003854 [Planctomycetaceae bacterium SH139]
MPARDDSVIRGSLIACSIFLVLSLIVNFLLWRSADVYSSEASAAATRLSNMSTDIQRKDRQITYLQGVIGVGELTKAQLDDLAESGSGDANFEKVVQDVATAMTYFGPEVDESRKNLSALPEYLTGQIRTLSEQYNNAIQAQQREKARADAEVKVAQDAQQRAENLQQQSEDEKEQLRTQFENDRQQMKLAGEQLKDQVRNQAAKHLTESRALNQQIGTLNTEKTELLATIDDQRRELNRMRNSQFEVAQGKVTYTRPGDRLVMIDLGASDALRKGVTFEVYGAEKSNVAEAEAKAMIEVVAIRGDHLAEARILGDPFASNPIIPGDKVYSPFWAPGRKVRIALAGSIDINRDGKANSEDIDILRGVIQAAGAEVAAVVDPSGRRAGQQLDSGIRFLVVGERPEAADGADQAATDRELQALAEIGAMIDEARQKGITIIPAEKLVGFLKTMDDAITIPLGPTARGSDFPPSKAVSGRRIKSDVSGFYRRTPPSDGN